MSELLKREQDGRVLRLRLNRPGKRNALSREMCLELLAAFRDADADPGTGAVLLEAEGKVFCAGLDLDELESGQAAGDAALHGRLFRIGETITKPIVAAVQGPAIAGGMALVANAHIAVAARGASFGMTEIRLGLFPYIAFDAIVNAVGRRRALELCLSGRVFSATDALAWGLVQHVAPEFEFDDLAFSVASSMAGANPAAVSGGLAFSRSGAGSPVERHERALRSPEVRVAVGALRRKGSG